MKLARQVRPDVILMNINMPGVGGIQATRIIHQEMPEIRIIDYLCLAREKSLPKYVKLEL